MNPSQADLMDEYKQLDVERDELRGQLEGASGDKASIEARIVAIEQERSALWNRIMHGGIEFGGE